MRSTRPTSRFALLLAAGAIVIASAIIVGLSRSVSADRPVVINGTAAPPIPTLNANQVAQGAILYAQYCASCHGANLEGAPNWQQRLADGSLPAPPHDSSGHTWHHSNTLLLTIIAEGGQAVYGDAVSKSNMPRFKDQLTIEEIAAILDFIKSKWGDDEREFQWWVSATRP
ncbi:MAG TPA: c-type cytochrome [Anaerolineales bacterium]|nr:c-type cytochrome [Anaerolineales bacterium]